MMFFLFLDNKKLYFVVPVASPPKVPPHSSPANNLSSSSEGTVNVFPLDISSE